MSDRRRRRTMQLGIMARFPHWIVRHHRRHLDAYLRGPEPLETTR